MLCEIDVFILFLCFFIFRFYETYIIFIIWVLQFSLFLVLIFNQSPSYQRIVTKSLYYRNNWLFVTSKQLDDFLTCMFKYSMYAARLHSFDKHSCKSKRYSFRVLFSHFINIKAISEINMNNLTCISLNHNIVWVSIT